jgi:NAD(P)-dependent dehydrogenase (short-subunit alcohol dehydrogenase family)
MRAPPFLCRGSSNVSNRSVRCWSDDWSEIQARWISEMLGTATVSRLGRVDEVADLVAFMSSPLADYIVGENIRIDGGLTPTMN